jgi:cob(I)alamin adenosyltransferase
MGSSFFTRGGDDGYTGLLGAGRIAKETLRMEAIGVVDEASAVLGVARAHALSKEVPPVLMQVQRDLYLLMAELAATPENSERFRGIDDQKVRWLEEQTTAMEAVTPMPREFIVPGDTVNGAYLDLARVVVRRAERRVAALVHSGEVQNAALLRYLNRLSSLCFVLELHENHTAGNTNITLAKADD